MATYLITGGTGFLGRHLLQRLVQRDDAQLHVLVRSASLPQLQRLAATLDAEDRIHPLVGDLCEEGLGVSSDVVKRLTGDIDHVVHLAALYDMSAEDEANREVNVEGTRRVVEFANGIRAKRFHHVSSVAVAGAYSGRFDERMFDEGQPLPSPYHATKFEAEKLVREQLGMPWRIYRPSIVVGDSQTGEMGKVDGPYYFFPIIAALSDLPLANRLPLVGVDLGRTNIVPVDYVAEAMDALMHADDLDGRVFHLTSPKMQKLTDVYNAFAKAAGAPSTALSVPAPPLTGQALSAARSMLNRVPGFRPTAQLALARLGLPAETLPHANMTPTIVSDETRAVLSGLGVDEPPPLQRYAKALWDYWSAHLDPLRARRRRPGGPLAGRTVVVTGASSGIGRETALAIAAHGGVPLLLARRTEELEKVKAEIEGHGGRAAVYSVDLTSEESVSACVKQMIADHPAIDMLVNNAGRSIRRSVKLSYDRFHDYERTMAINYFGPVRLILALLPHMTERKFGHIVNISSIGVQTYPPRFSAYVASKAALDAFTQVISSEVVGDGVTFTVIHMPLVRTPMIAPTKIYDRFPTLSPEEAAGLVVRALEKRPPHIGTRLGTVGAVAHALAPRISDAVLYTAYQVFPDSKAASGGKATTPSSPPEALSRGAAVMVRLLPGVHW